MLASLPPCETHLQSNQARGTVLVCISTQVQTLLTSLNVCVTFRPLALGGAAPSDLHRPLDLTRIKYIPKHTGVDPSGKTPGFRTWLLDQIWGILVTAARELGLAGLILVFCHMLPSLNHKTLPLLLQNKDDSQVPPCPASPWLLQRPADGVRLHCPALCPLTALGQDPRSATPWGSRAPVPPNHLLAAASRPGRLRLALWELAAAAVGLHHAHL